MLGLITCEREAPQSRSSEEIKKEKLKKRVVFGNKLCPLGFRTWMQGSKYLRKNKKLDKRSIGKPFKLIEHQSRRSGNVNAVDFHAIS